MLCDCAEQGFSVVAQRVTGRGFGAMLSVNISNLSIRNCSIKHSFPNSFESCRQLRQQKLEILEWLRFCLAVLAARILSLCL